MEKGDCQVITILIQASNHFIRFSLHLQFEFGACYWTGTEHTDLFVEQPGDEMVDSFLVVEW